MSFWKYFERRYYLLVGSFRSTKFNVIFLRHALAPGYGDPSEFDISECKTQRNLNQEGRDQAISIGIRLKMEGFVR